MAVSSIGPSSLITASYDKFPCKVNLLVITAAPYRSSSSDTL